MIQPPGRSPDEPGFLGGLISRFAADPDERTGFWRQAGVGALRNLYSYADIVDRLTPGNLIEDLDEEDFARLAGEAREGGLARFGQIAGAIGSEVPLFLAGGGLARAGLRGAGAVGAKIAQGARGAGLARTAATAERASDIARAGAVLGRGPDATRTARIGADIIAEAPISALAAADPSFSFLQDPEDSTYLSRLGEQIGLSAVGATAAEGLGAAARAAAPRLARLPGVASERMQDFQDAIMSAPLARAGGQVVGSAAAGAGIASGIAGGAAAARGDEDVGQQALSAAVGSGLGLAGVAPATALGAAAMAARPGRRSKNMLADLYAEGFQDRDGNTRPITAEEAERIRTGIPEFAEAVERKAIERHGRKLDVEDEGDRALVAEILAEEARAELGKDASAVEWYRRSLEEAYQKAASVYPELYKDPLARDAFRFALAITSNGLAVDANAKAADKVYRAWRESDKNHFPEFSEGKAGGAMAHMFRVMNDLIDAEGAERAFQMLDTEMTVDQMKRMGFNVSGEGTESVVPFSVIAGPKIGGGFYRNLGGFFDVPTMDRWFRRTIGRVTGDLREVYTPEQVTAARKKFIESADRDILRELGVTKKAMKADDAVAEDAIQRAARIWEKRFKDAPTDDRPKKPQWAKDAEGFLKKVDPTTRDAPGGAKERDALRDIVRRVQENMRDAGDGEFDAATIQALLWYPEKRLYRDAGIRAPDDDISYSEAFDQIYQITPEMRSDIAWQASQTVADEARMGGTEGTPFRKGLTGEDARKPFSRFLVDHMRSKQEEPYFEFKTDDDGQPTTERKGPIRSGFDASGIWQRSPRTNEDGQYALRFRGDLDRRSFDDIGVGEATRDLRFTETASPQQAARFWSNLDAAKKSDPQFMWSVDLYERPQDYEGLNLIQTPDGKMGVAVKPDGDIVSFYRSQDLPDPKKDPRFKGTTYSLLTAALQAGGQKLDAFHTAALDRIYQRMGFRPVGRTPFVEEYAPPNWSKAKHGTPDVIAYVYDAGPARRVDVDDIPLYKDYDDMIAAQDAAMVAKREEQMPILDEAWRQERATQEGYRDDLFLTDEATDRGDIPQVVESSDIGPGVRTRFSTTPPEDGQPVAGRRPLRARLTERQILDIGGDIPTEQTARKLQLYRPFRKTMKETKAEGYDALARAAWLKQNGELPAPNTPTEVIQRNFTEFLQSQGYGAVRRTDPANPGSGEMMVFSPATLRSPDARFDQRARHSSDPLRTVAPFLAAGAAGGAAQAAAGAVPEDKEFAEAGLGTAGAAALAAAAAAGATPAMLRALRGMTEKNLTPAVRGATSEGATPAVPQKVMDANREGISSGVNMRKDGTITSDPTGRDKRKKTAGERFRRFYQRRVNRDQSLEDLDDILGAGGRIKNAVSASRGALQGGYEEALETLKRDLFDVYDEATLESAQELTVMQRLLELADQGRKKSGYDPPQIRARIAELVSLPRVQEASDRIQGLYYRDLHDLHEGDVINRLEFQKLLDAGRNYVPLTRDIHGEAIAPGSDALRQQAKLRRMGDEVVEDEVIIDPITNYVAYHANTKRMIAEKQIEIALRDAIKLDPDSAEGWIKQVKKNELAKTDDYVMLGDRYYRITDRVLGERLGRIGSQNVPRATRGAAMAAARTAKDLLRVGTTGNPVFGAKNFLRDTQFRAIQDALRDPLRAVGEAGAGATLGAATTAFDEDADWTDVVGRAALGGIAGFNARTAGSSLRAMMDILQTELKRTGTGVIPEGKFAQDFATMVKMGGYGAGWLPGSTKDVAGVIKRLQKDGLDFRDVVLPRVPDMMDAAKRGDVEAFYENSAPWMAAVNRALENANRLAEFRTVRSRQLKEYANLPEQTAGDNLYRATQDAVRASRDITLDFARSGSHMQNINSTVAFFNAMVQGMDKFARTIKKNPVSSLALMTGAVGAPGLALTLSNQQREDYWDVPVYERNLFYLVPKGEEEGSGYWRIPKMFQFSAPESLMSRGLDYHTLTERGLDEAAKATMMRGATQVLDTEYGAFFNPLTYVPTAVEPIIETAMNRDTFRKMPIDPVSDAFTPILPKDQYDARTSEVSKGIAETAALAGLQISPARIDHLMRSYLGTGGSLALDTVDAVAGRERVGRRRPIVGAFETKPTSRSDREQNFNERYRKAERAYNSWQRYLDAGDIDKAERLMERKGDEIQFFMATEDAYGDMKDLRALRRELYQNEDLGSIASREAQIRDLNMILADITDSLMSF